MNLGAFFILEKVASRIVIIGLWVLSRTAWKLNATKRFFYTCIGNNHTYFICFRTTLFL